MDHLFTQSTESNLNATSSAFLTTLKQMEAVPILIIIGAPVLTSMGFKFAFVENILVRLLMVGSLIYAIRFANAPSGPAPSDLGMQGPVFSLLVLLAIVTLLLERNHVVVAGLPEQKADAKIIGPANLYPMKAPDTISHISVKEVYDDHESNHEADVHISDERAEIKEGPSNHDSPSFYKSLGLV